MGKTTVTVHLEEIEKELLKKYADKAELTVSTIIRRAVREYLVKRKIIKEDSKLFLLMR